MGLGVNVICRNYAEDRVIPRFSRYLCDFLGWALTPGPAAGFDLYYLSGYFEHSLLKHQSKGAKLAAYFTHREEYPPGNAKAKQFDSVAGMVDFRIATAEMYANQLIEYGDTVQIYPPVEREKFIIPKSKKNKRIVAGFSGYTYPNKRKGEDLARALISSPAGKSVSWMASGRGWPVKTIKYKWSEMDRFYQALDILLITATVEGVPMPPLEALSCGVSVVIPRAVGLLDEIPDRIGVHRYERGNIKSMLAAFQAAIDQRSGVDRGELRSLTERFSVVNWCENHRYYFEELIDNG